MTSSPMQLTPHSVNESTIVSWASLNYIDDDTQVLGAWMLDHCL